MPRPYIIKASGEQEPYSDEKVARSLYRAGASDELVREASAVLRRRLRPGVRSDAIFETVRRHLARRRPEISARYSLKRAIMQLGPAGYRFERYVARLLEGRGYKTAVGQLLRGACAEHEVDVIAEKDGRRSIYECKFHNRSGTRSDLKVALYTHARYEDLRTGSETLHAGWLVTNTRVTTQAERYSRCVGLNVLAWRTPYQRGLEHLIDSQGLYPLTVLRSGRTHDLNALMDAGVLVVPDLLERSSEELERLGVRRRVLRSLREEARLL